MSEFEQKILYIVMNCISFTLYQICNYDAERAKYLAEVFAPIFLEEMNDNEEDSNGD